MNTRLFLGALAAALVLATAGCGKKDETAPTPAGTSPTPAASAASR